MLNVASKEEIIWPELIHREIDLMTSVSEMIRGLHFHRKFSETLDLLMNWINDWKWMLLYFVWTSFCISIIIVKAKFYCKDWAASNENQKRKLLIFFLSSESKTNLFIHLSHNRKMLEDVKVKFDFTVEMRSLKMYIIVSYNCQS